METYPFDTLLMTCTFHIHDNVMYSFLQMYVYIYIFAVLNCLWASKLILNIMINENISRMPQ